VAAALAAGLVFREDWRRSDFNANGRESAALPRMVANETVSTISENSFHSFHSWFLKIENQDSTQMVANVVEWKRSGTRKSSQSMDGLVFDHEWALIHTNEEDLFRENSC